MSQLRYLIQWFPAAAIPFFLFDRSLSVLVSPIQVKAAFPAEPSRADPIRSDLTPFLFSDRFDGLASS
jgi:hypothetical protein